MSEQRVHFMPDALSWEVLSAAFDRLYARAEVLNARYDENLCAIRGGTCAHGRKQANPKASFCCAGNGARREAASETCGHLGKSGCTVQSLRCKLWFCQSISLARRRVPLQSSFAGTLYTADHDSFESLLQEADNYGFLVHRGSKEQSLKQAARKWRLKLPEQG